MNSIIVQQARTWLGTPFKHQGRIKYVGCDCIGLVIGVFRELSPENPRFLIYQKDRADYARIPDGSILKSSLEKYLVEIPVNIIKPGDILLFRFDYNPQHVGIVSDYSDGLGIIHCYAQARKVVEHRLDEIWESRIVSAYKLDY